MFQIFRPADFAGQQDVGRHAPVGFLVGQLENAFVHNGEHDNRRGRLLVFTAALDGHLDPISRNVILVVGLDLQIQMLLRRSVQQTLGSRHQMIPIFLARQPFEDRNANDPAGTTIISGQASHSLKLSFGLSARSRSGESGTPSVGDR